MIDPDLIWAAVSKRSPAERRMEIPKLRQFLSEHDSHHAQALSGQGITGPLDIDSGHSLESAIIERIKNIGSFTIHAGAEWLRLIYDASRTYSEAGGQVKHYTRLALLLTPETSPFSPILREAAKPVISWQTALGQWMAGLASRTPTASEWQAGMVLSATLNGALVDNGKISTLLSVLDKPFPVANRRPYIEFHQKFEGLGDFHCQRWFIDPITELISHRRPAQLQILTKSELGKAIQTLLSTEGVSKSQLPTGISALIKATTADWFGRASRLDIEIMRRGVISHGFHDRTWTRLFRSPIQIPAATSEAIEPIIEPELDWRADVDLLFPWWQRLKTAIQTGQPTVDECIIALHSESSLSTEANTYLAWVNYLLAGNNATRKKLSTKTIFTYITIATPVLLSLFGQTDPATLDIESLTEGYEEAMSACPPDVPGRLLAKAIREFHAFLSKRYDIKPLKSVRDVLGEDAGLEPVDANILTIDEYFNARAYLKKQLLHGRDPDDIWVAMMAMTLAFRGGLRRMEIFGLRLHDVSSIKHLEMLILEHAGRRLKSKASGRTVPIRFLLTSEERREFRRWIARRHQEEKKTGFSQYLFALAQRDLLQVSSETVSDRIIEALCHATGQQKTKIHQLRHSFGTWLYLAFRAPDYPGITSFFEDAPKTKRFLSQGNRLRKVFGLGGCVTSRTYAFAVARLLGHSSPMVSLGHYIHCNEFIQYHTTLNQLNRIPREALFGIAQLNPAWGTRLLSHGALFYLEHIRRQQPNDAPAELAPDLLTQEKKQKPIGRKPKTEPDGWITLRTIHGFLYQCATTSTPPLVIATELGIDENKAESLILASQKLAAMFKIKTIKNTLIPEIPFPRTSSEIAWEANVEARLKRAFALSPKITINGVMAHLKQFTQPKGDVVFRGTKECRAFEIYTEFVRLLGFQDKQIEIVIRSVSNNLVPSWARRRLKIFGKYQIRRVNPPVINDTNSYGPWIGIFICDEHSARPMLTRSLILLAAIAQVDFSEK
jgi:integrase